MVREDCPGEVTFKMEGSVERAFQVEGIAKAWMNLACSSMRG